MKLFKRKAEPQLPEVPRITRAQLESIFHGPNGAGQLRAQREYSLQASLAFEEVIGKAEKHLAFAKAMKASADGVVADINSILGEVQA